MNAIPTGAGLGPGAAVAGYRLEGVLGRQTGSGVVYAATHLSSGRIVAVKMLPAATLEDEESDRLFREDVSIQVALRHPHLVRTYGGGLSRVGPFLVMDLVEGTSLKSAILFREVTDAHALDLLAPVAEALDLAGRSGMPHRDLKPQKILLPRDEPARAVLTGLGAGKPRSAGREELGRHLETLEYASPEQLRGEPVTRASNVYSMACIVFECLTGQPPRDGDALSRATQERSLAALRPDLNPAIGTALRRGMADDPRERFQTVAELVRGTAELVVESHAGPPPATGETVRAAPRSRASDRDAARRDVAATLGAATLESPSGRVATPPSTSRDRPDGSAETSPSPAVPQRRRGLGPVYLGSLAAALLLPGAAAAGWLWGGRSVSEESPPPPAPVAVPRSSPASTLEYADALHEQVAVLNGSRTSLRDRLARARTPNGQAETAHELARVYTSTAASLAELSEPPAAREAHGAVVTAARRARDAYRRLTVSAQRGDVRGYRRAAAAVGSAELSMERALRRLSTIGRQRPSAASR